MEEESKSMGEGLRGPTYMLGTTLMYFDNVVHHHGMLFNTDEIIFKQPVLLHQFRIIKADSNPHSNLKHLQRYLHNHT